MLALWRRGAPYLLVTLLALPAVWPLAGPGLPRTNDALPHFYRALELGALARAGALLPRWAPHLVHGYGYPVFNFFPYLAHYLVVGLNALGLDLLDAYNAACALALLASALFAFWLGREHFGLAAGVLAGAAYVYSPYLLYDTYVRGSLPESLALALLPLALLFLRRAARGDWPAVAWGALALGAAVLAHHGVMLQAMPFVLAYALVETWWARGGPLAQARTHRALLAVLLGLLLSAFFWLPAAAEARFVQTARGTGSGSMSYLDNFLSLGELLAWPRLPVDPRLLNPPVVRALPHAAAVLAAPAWLRLGGRRRRAHGPALLFFTLAAVAAALLVLPLARPLWAALPPLQLTLFPWRLLGPISLFLALAAAALFAPAPVSAPATPPNAETGAPSPSAAGTAQSAPAVTPRRDRALNTLGLAAALVVIVAAGLPFAAPPREAAPAAPTLADLAHFEVPPTFIGTTTVGEYLPIWVQQLPDTGGDRLQLMLGETPARFDAPGAIVEVLEARAIGAAYSVAAAEPVRFVYRQFYFPGWHALLDGQRAPLEITQPEGLMAVTVPAGVHTLSFALGATLPRLAGEGLSVCALLAVAALAAGPRLLARRASPAAVPRPAAPPTTERVGAGLLAVAAVLVLARPLLFDAGRTPWLRAGLGPDGLAGVPALNLDVAGELTLLGAEISPSGLTGDQDLTVALYWQARKPLGVAYGFQVRLVDAAGQAWSEVETPRPRDWRFAPGTDLWPVDQYVLDPYTLTPLAGVPPGAYTVEVTVFAYHNLQMVGRYPAGVVTITRPTRSRVCPEAVPAVPAAALDLRAAQLPVAGRPGDDLTAELCWLAVTAPGAGLVGELRLLDAATAVRAAQPFDLGGPYPTSRWAAGDVLRDQVTLRLPAELESGSYTWALVVADGPQVGLGALAVTAPERHFAAPLVGEVVGGDLGPITLYGLSLPRDGLAAGGEAPVTLIWRADEAPGDSYHVFVHLEAADGRLVAQSDGVPADWGRRTTGWLRGEFVVDARQLHLPIDLAPGAYTLAAGLYLPGSGARLTTAQFPDGRIALGAVQVE